LPELLEDVDYETTSFILTNPNMIRGGIRVNFEDIVLDPYYDGINIFYRDR
jgi:hypothetical protein